MFLEHRHLVEYLNTSYHILSYKLLSWSLSIKQKLTSTTRSWAWHLSFLYVFCISIFQTSRIWQDHWSSWCPIKWSHGYHNLWSLQFCLHLSLQSFHSFFQIRLKDAEFDSGYTVNSVLPKVVSSKKTITMPMRPPSWSFPSHELPNHFPAQVIIYKTHQESTKLQKVSHSKDMQWSKVPEKWVILSYFSSREYLVWMRSLVIYTPENYVCPIENGDVPISY